MKNFNWKFWGWRKRVRDLEAECLERGRAYERLNEQRIEAVAREAEAEKEKEELREQLSTINERLSTVYQRTPGVVTERTNMERLLVLAGMGENALWQVVLSFADEFERGEKESALRPDLTDGVRQYNAGRAAGAYDFACALRDLRVQAEREAGRMKGKG